MKEGMDRAFVVDDIHESCVLSILECGEHFALGRNILFMSLFF